MLLIYNKTCFCFLGFLPPYCSGAAVPPHMCPNYQNLLNFEDICFTNARLELMFWHTWVVQWFALSFHMKRDSYGSGQCEGFFYRSYNNRSNFLVLEKVFFITKCFIVSLFEQNGSSTDSPRKHSCCFCVHIYMHLFS